MQLLSLNQLRCSLFSERIGTRFRVFADQIPVPDLTLVEATQSPQSSRGADQPDSFSLVFTGPAGRQLGQQIYRFEHEDFGAFELFIVPIGSNGVVVRYEAVINRCHR
jgi:hypothetical protein